MIVGTVVGAGIYIMIGPLAVATGPGLFLCYLFALITAVASSICYAQVASIFPATAATYQYTKMFYNDFVGFLIGWLRVITTFCGLALMGKGFAHYFTTFWDVDSKLLAVAVLTLFYIINLLGIKTTQKVQSLLVIIVLAGLVSFCGFGFSKIRINNITPVLKAGIGSVLKGGMTAFYAYTGLAIVAEIGDEIQDPQKNIPRSIFVASIIIGILYLVTALVFSGSLGWTMIKEYKPNLSQAAKLLFNPRIAVLIQFSAIMAIITPINAIYIAGSRFLYSLANDGIMPSVFAKINRFKVPGLAMTLNYILALIMVLIDLPILFLGTISSIVLLTGMALVAGACLKLKKEYPQEFNNALFKISDRILYFTSVLTIVSTILLTLISFIEDLTILLSLVFWLTVGCSYYYIRIWLCS